MAHPPGKKIVIQMSGAPGSGKSSVARSLRPHINATIIDHDVLRSGLLESSSGDLVFNYAAKQAYALQWGLLRDMLAQNLDAVIVDSTCNYPEVLDRGKALAAEFGYRYWYVECRIRNIDLLDQRLRARPAMPSQRPAVDALPAAAQVGEARVDQNARARFEQWMERPCRPEPSCLITVDATKEVHISRDEILARISMN